jgi:hypothetical protein
MSTSLHIGRHWRRASEAGRYIFYSRSLNLKPKRMRTALLPWTLCAILLAAPSANSAETNRPDCVGIRLGMPITEARERLRSYAPTLEIQTVESQIPELGEKPVPETLLVVRRPPPRTEGTNLNAAGRLVPSPVMDSEPIETLQAALTLPPNEPVVWKVVRSLRFEPGREQAKSALLDALREKYGKESLTLDTRRDRVSRFWVLRPDGSLVDGQGAQECSTFCQSAFLGSSPLDDALVRGVSKEFLNRLRSIVSRSTIGSAQTALPDPHHCNSMTYIVAELSLGANPELVTQMRVALIDAPLHQRATEATEAVVQKANATRAKQETDKAKEQPTPKL